MKSAAIGFRAHSGWTSLVVMALEDGAPIILSRQRPHLVETFSYTFRQPYHTAAKMEGPEASDFVLKVRNEARKLAFEAIRNAEEQAGELGFRVKKCGLLEASGRPLPEFQKILASHALIHTADGELFREALLHAGARRKLAITRIRDRELLRDSSKILHTKVEVLLRKLRLLGKTVGSPWSQDEKFATLAAWVALKR